MTTGANALVMKEININLVRRALKARQEATKQQIAEATGLSVVTVGTILQKLIDAHIAFDVGVVASMGGRPAQLFRFNADYSHVLVLFTREQNGMDMLYVRVANLNGVCVYAVEAPLGEINLRAFEPFIDAALQEYASIRAIGFGLPGIEVDGQIVGGDYPTLTGTAFLTHYRERYQLPVVIENDVNAACVGYVRRHQLESGAALYLYFPQKYPPGGGIYINDQLYKGYSNYAGEVSGMPLGIDWHDPTLYQSLARACEAIATLIHAVSLLLNPQHVILYGAFLTDAHLQTIQRRCAERQPVKTVPQLNLADDFTQDYQQGIIEQALALLEPQMPITF